MLSRANSGPNMNALQRLGTSGLVQSSLLAATWRNPLAAISTYVLFSELYPLSVYAEPRHVEDRLSSPIVL